MIKQLSVFTVIYLGSTIALGTASVCLTVVVLNLHHKGSHTPVPAWARSLLLYHCAKIFGMHAIKRSPMTYRGSVRTKANNYRKSSHEETDNHEMVEVQHILASSSMDKTLSRNVAENYIRNETMQYHNVDPPTTWHVSRDEALANQGAEDIIKEWRLLARVMDRIFFIAIFLIMTMCAVFTLLSPWYTKKGPRG